MKRTYLSNAFSLSMLHLGHVVVVSVRSIDLDTAKAPLQDDFESAVGHQTTAEVLVEVMSQERQEVLP